MRTSLLLSTALLLGSVLPASAQVAISENFSTGLPSSLEVVAGGGSGTQDFTIGNAIFNGEGDQQRSMLRTIGSNYASVSFVAEVTVTVNSTTEPYGANVGFFGMGTGVPLESAYWEPATTPTIYLGASPTSFSTGAIFYNDNGTQTNPADSTAGDGTHRIRMTWDAGTELMQFAIDQSYSGSFFADTTYSNINGADNGFTSGNAHIFFGGASGVQFDNLSITVSAVPEPSSIAALAGLFALGAVALRRRPRSG